MTTIRKVFLLILISIILLSGTTMSSLAQAGRQIIISAPDTSNFPRLRIYFDAEERDGSIIGDLTAEQIVLRENGIVRELVDFQALSPGIQIVAAINLSPPFAIQDNAGVSRLEYIQQGLLNWIDQPLRSDPDDLSLISNDGLELTHLDEKDPFREALESYAPDPREIEGDLTVLARAIEIAADPVDQLGMKRAVLFFSSEIPSESTNALESLLSLARENQVQVYTILVASPAFFNTSGATRLQILSTETGGAFLPFSGEEPLVDFGLLLAPLRSTYLIEYDSQIVTPGDQQLELRVATSLGESLGSVDFFLDVQPPNPTFLSPPREIVRRLPDGEEENTPTTSYIPAVFPLRILVEFPDNLSRQLDEMIIRVDGEIVERKTEPPCQLQECIFLG